MTINQFPIKTRTVDFQQIIDAKGYADDAEAFADLAQANANDAKVYASVGDLPAVTASDNGTWARVLVDSGVQAWLVVAGAWAFQAWLEGPHYDDVTAFFASTDTFTAGIIVGTRAEGFAYRAVDTATATTVANAGGQAFEVLRGPYGYNASAYGTTGAALAKAMTALSDGDTLIIDADFSYDNSTSPLVISANNITVIGRGTITGTSSGTNDIVALTGEGITWDGPGVKGNGTFYDGTVPASESDRHSLIVIEGDDCEIRSGLFEEPWMCGLRFNAVNGGRVGAAVVIEGGPTTMQATYAHHVRFKNCFNSTAEKFTSRPDAGGGQAEEGLMATGGNGGNFSIDCRGSYDHGIYVIAVDSAIIDGAYTVSDSAGIVCGGSISTGTSNKASTVTNNTCVASGTRIGDIGLYVRDHFNMNVSGNKVFGFPRSYQVNPQSFQDAAQTNEGLLFDGNLARGWTEYGIIIGVAGAAVSKVEGIDIVDFDSQPADSGILTTGGQGSHIYSVAPAGVVNNIRVVRPRLKRGRYFGYMVRATRVTISDPECRDASVNGFYFNDCDYPKVIGGEIINPGTLGIQFAGACFEPEVRGVLIQDIQTTKTMSEAIDGDNDVVRGRFYDNILLGWTGSRPISRVFFAGNTNDARGNRTGTDPLTGVVTLNGAVATTISNNNINTGTNYRSRVRLAPINQAAATLVGSANSPFVQDLNMIAQTSFQIRQAGAAAGTEEFFYEIVQ